MWQAFKEKEEKGFKLKKVEKDFDLASIKKRSN